MHEHHYCAVTAITFHISGVAEGSLRELCSPHGVWGAGGVQLTSSGARGESGAGCGGRGGWGR